MGGGGGGGRGGGAGGPPYTCPTIGPFRRKLNFGGHLEFCKTLNGKKKVPGILCLYSILGFGINGDHLLLAAYVLLSSD